MAPVTQAPVCQSVKPGSRGLSGRQEVVRIGPRASASGLSPGLLCGPPVSSVSGCPSSSFFSLQSSRLPRCDGTGSLFLPVWRLPSVPGPGRPFQLLSVLTSWVRHQMQHALRATQGKLRAAPSKATVRKPNQTQGRARSTSSLRAKSAPPVNLCIPDYFVFSKAPSGITP